MFLTVAFAVPVVAPAGPLIIEETAKITSPNPAYLFPVSVAVDGDWLIATGTRDVPDSDRQDNSTWLYQRQTNGTWTLVRLLHQVLYENDNDEPSIKVAMQGGIAVIVKEFATAIFERSGTSWIAKQSPIVTDGMDVEVNGGTIVVTSGHCEWSTNQYRKGTDGAWTLVRSTPPEPEPNSLCENEDTRGDTDVAANGSTSIVATYSSPGSARVFEGPFGTAPVMTRLESPQDPPLGFGHLVAIENTSAIVGNTSDIGFQAYTRNTTGQWINNGSVRSPDWLAIITPEQVELAGSLAILSQPQDPLHGLRTGSVALYQRNTDGTYRYVAKLLASERDNQ
jgi:hypothetical protein